MFWPTDVVKPLEARAFKLTAIDLAPSLAETIVLATTLCLASMQ